MISAILQCQGVHDYGNKFHGSTFSSIHSHKEEQERENGDPATSSISKTRSSLARDTAFIDNYRVFIINRCEIITLTKVTLTIWNGVRW